MQAGANWVSDVQRCTVHALNIYDLFMALVEMQQAETIKLKLLLTLLAPRFVQILWTLRYVSYRQVRLF